MVNSNSLVASVSALVSGTVVAQLIIIIATPILSRFYTPDHFGVLAFFLSVVAVLNVISSLKYETAIPIAESEAEVHSLKFLSLIILFFFSGLTSLVVLILPPKFLGTELVDSTYKLNFLIPISVFISGLYILYVHLLIRAGEFKVIAKSKVIQSLTVVSFQIVFSWFGVIALVLANIFAQATAFLFLFKNRSMSEVKSYSFDNVSIKKAALRYKKFPIFTTADGLINKLGAHLPTFILALYFSPAAAGSYLMAERVLRLPVTLISNAVSKVFYSRLGANYLENKYIIEEYIVVAIWLFLPFILSVGVFGVQIFGLLLGPEWELAGQFASVITPWIFLVFIASPLSILFAVLEKQHFGAVFQFILLLMRSLSILVTVVHNDPLLTIKAFVGASTLCWIGFLGWVILVNSINVKRLALAFMTSLLFFLLVFAFAQQAYSSFGAFSFSFPALCFTYYYYVIYKKVVVFK